MRRILLAGAALAFGAGVAIAGDSAEVYLSAEQPQICTINTGDQNVDLGYVVDVTKPLAFNYECNFNAGSANINLASTNGGVKNGANVATYGVWLNDAAPAGSPSGWDQSNTMLLSGGGRDYLGLLAGWGTANNPTNAGFAVGLTQALPVAGVYTDTLVVTISP